MMMPSMSEQVICFDLDDTLYKEIDFLQSAFREIATHVARTGHGQPDDNYRLMLDAYRRGESPFQTLNRKLDIDLPVDSYLKIYRGHKPDIHLPAETYATLSVLKARGFTLGLITDGRSLTQRNKIAALGLDSFFPEENIIISGEIGSEKPSELNYRHFSDLYKDARFTYVGDNPQKDFIAPARLGWTSICLLDDGRNIHPQDFSLPPTPDHLIKSLPEILNILLT